MIRGWLERWRWLWRFGRTQRIPSGLQAPDSPNWDDSVDVALKPALLIALALSILSLEPATYKPKPTFVLKRVDFGHIVRAVIIDHHKVRPPYLAMGSVLI